MTEVLIGLQKTQNDWQNPTGLTEPDHISPIEYILKYRPLTIRDKRKSS